LPVGIPYGACALHSDNGLGGIWSNATALTDKNTKNRSKFFIIDSPYMQYLYGIT